MGLNIKNEAVEQLAEELARLTGESKTSVILGALRDRKQRLSLASQRPGLIQVLEFLEREIWPSIPPALLGRPPGKKEREAILGYGRSGV